MNSPDAVGEESAGHWPTFPLRYTFNPTEVDGPDSPDPDELVIFDAKRSEDESGAWLSASRGAYVAIEEIR